MSAVLTQLQVAATAYAGAKRCMDAVAAQVREERGMVPAIVASRPETNDAPALADHLEQMATSREVVTDLDQHLGAAIAVWRGTIFDLQAAAVAVIGVLRPAGCSRLAAALQLAAQAYAAAKIDVDRHIGPFSGVIYASKIATWRGAMMDLDNAARAYAGTAKPSEN
jgi:hypothetical protein